VRALTGGEARVERHRHRAEQHARVEGLRECEPRRQRDRHPLAGARATLGKLRRTGARGGQQLGVGPAALWRLKRRVPWPCRGRSS